MANILRALTDKVLLRQSIAKLGGGMLLGYAGGLASLKVAMVENWGLSTSTFGAGMVVGARIAIPALVVGLIGEWSKPYLVRIHWLDPGAPFRKIGFIIALGTILGAALVDVSMILVQAWRQFMRKETEPAKPSEDWKRVNMWKLLLWVAFWGVAIVVVGSQVLHQPAFYLAIAVALCFVFVLVNGISLGISDSNPISSAFVMGVFILAAFKLTNPGVGLLCASILLIACSEGGDMQQDRSTGWRLGTNRIVQFRYQVIGIAVGAILAVALAKIFMNAYPVLQEDQFSNPHLPGAQKWQSAMTFKFVGALRGITNPKPAVMEALRLGILIGLVIEIARKLLKNSSSYKRFATGSVSGKTSGLYSGCNHPAQSLRIIVRRLRGIEHSILVDCRRCGSIAIRFAAKPSERQTPQGGGRTPGGHEHDFPCRRRTHRRRFTGRVDDWNLSIGEVVTGQMKDRACFFSLVISLIIAGNAFAQNGEPDHSKMSQSPEGDHSMNGMAGMDRTNHSQMGHSMNGFYGPYPMTREASGTAWQPEASPMGGLHYMFGDWMLMLHGFAFAVYDDQLGKRGDQKFYSPNMLMGMLDHPLGPGTIGLRAMLTLEPATIGKTGYPLFLQTGETADGKTPLIDRQHPHDLFMELAGTYSLPLGEHSSVFAYFGYPGEPALGPATFMHRYSGMDIPEAPITHHWLDSTHVTFGVATLGYIWRQFKLDGSIFTGREPDENRWDFEQPRFDSYAARLTYNPTEAWSMQASYGNIHSPEQLEPNVDRERITSSVSYHYAWNRNNWQTTLGWGRNISHPGVQSDGFLLESLVNFHATHTFFGRVERVDKDELSSAGQSAAWRSVHREQGHAGIYL